MAKADDTTTEKALEALIAHAGPHPGITLKSKEEPEVPVIDSPIGFPSALCLLSYVMWSMSFVGMVLKLIGGMRWIEHWSRRYQGQVVFHKPKPPPAPDPPKPKRSIPLKRLGLLSAMSIANTMPMVEMHQDLQLRQDLRKYRGKSGMLNTCRLTQVEIERVREHVSYLPCNLMHREQVFHLSPNTSCVSSFFTVR